MNISRTWGLALALTLFVFLANFFLHPQDSLGLKLYSALSLGLALGIAGWLDTPDLPLARKLLYSALVLFALMGIGYAFWGTETMMSGMMRYSTAFMLYYLVASFRSSKSLKK